MKIRMKNGDQDDDKKLGIIFYCNLHFMNMTLHFHLIIMTLHFSLCRLPLPLQLSDGKPNERRLSHPLPALHPPGLPLASQGASPHLNPQRSSGGSTDPPRLPNVAKQEEGGPGRAAVLPLSPLLSLPGEERPLVALALQHYFIRNLIS